MDHIWQKCHVSPQISSLTTRSHIGYGKIRALESRVWIYLIETRRRKRLQTLSCALRRSEASSGVMMTLSSIRIITQFEDFDQAQMSLQQDQNRANCSEFLWLRTAGGRNRVEWPRSVVEKQLHILDSSRSTKTQTGSHFHVGRQTDDVGSLNRSSNPFIIIRLWPSHSSSRWGHQVFS